MRRLLLGICVSATCWISDVGAMECKTVDGESISSIDKCKSRDGQFVMVTRWELGNERYMSGCKCLHIDYRNTGERFEEEKSKANFTEEMRDMLRTLPTWTMVSVT